MRWESYTTWDDEEEFQYGNCFRVYSKSKYLDYMAANTFADAVLDDAKHYGVYCEDQIIDVMSDQEPVITKFQR